MSYFKYRRSQRGLQTWSLLRLCVYACLSRSTSLPHGFVHRQVSGIQFCLQGNRAPLCPFADTTALCFPAHYPRLNDPDPVPIKASFFFGPVVLQCTTLSHAAHVKYSQSQMLFWESNWRFLWMFLLRGPAENYLCEDNPRFSFPSSLEDNV